ncbi:MAG: hypothetical protein K2O14_03265 [Oscillospiraceae bacterium]|nr:hypothetical protein [Oscillospiraceae bacterium]
MPKPHIFKTGKIIVAAELAALLLAGAAIGFCIGSRRSFNSSERERLHVKKERLKADLLRSAAHDIRTPLAVIKMSTGLLDGDRLLPQERKETLRGIRESVDDLTLMMENILTLTGEKLTYRHLKMQSVSAAEIVSECAYNFRKLHDKIAVVTYVSDDLLEVMTDAQLIKRVMQNLLENAAGHGQATVINITVEAKKGFAEFRIADNGRGIPEYALGSLFKECPGGATDTEKGMGVGLSLCKAVIELHGGTIRGGNVKDGAEFVFTLPLEK